MLVYIQGPRRMWMSVLPSPIWQMAEQTVGGSIKLHQLNLQGLHYTPMRESHPDALLFCIIFLHSSNADIEVWYTPRLTCQSNFYCRELKLKLIYLYVPLFKSMDIKWLTTSDFCLKNMVKICNNQWSSKKTNPGRQDLKFKTCWSC